MNERYREKYRIESTRLKTWDYGRNGYYFITICTKDKIHFFGSVDGLDVILSTAGQIAETCLLAIPDHFPFVRLSDFVVMPNHIHGILIVDKGHEDGHSQPKIGNVSSGSNFYRCCRDAINRVSTVNDIIKNNGGVTGDRNPMLHQNISHIIRWYKGRCTYETHQTIPHFAWQPRFHDRIIRDADEYDRIRKYIRNNPLNWAVDEYNIKDDR